MKIQGVWRHGCGALLAGLAIVVGLALTTKSAKADAVVIRTTAPSLKAGQMVKTGEKVSLPAGATATLVGKDGKTISLTGPFNGLAESGGGGGGDPQVVAALSRLLTAKGTETSTLGATRSASGASKDDPYVVIPTDGDHCQVANAPAVMKRAIGIADEEIIITPEGGEPITVAWAAGELELLWPEAAAMKDKGVYFVKVPGRSKPWRIVTHVASKPMSSPVATVAWMADQGCRRQALVLLNQLH
ncbi:putative SH3 domain-containing protein [Azospirillaceae bacterium]